MDFFLNEILEDAEAAEILRNDSDLCAKAASVAKAIAANEPFEKPEEGMMQMAVLGHLASEAKKRNDARGIPHEITVASLKDINLWIGNYRKLFHSPGLREFNWLVMHYTGKIFRLGRLQFRPMKVCEGLPSGDWALEVHVPQGEPLDPDECLKSFARAKEFFPKHFPEMPADYFVCHSWLLNRSYERLLGPDANITRFGKLFTVFQTNSKTGAVYDRVFGFGFNPADLANAPENTRLQRAVKAHLLAGGELPDEKGYRRI